MINIPQRILEILSKEFGSAALAFISGVVGAVSITDGRASIPCLAEPRQAKSRIFAKRASRLAMTRNQGPGGMPVRLG